MSDEEISGIPDLAALTMLIEESPVATLLFDLSVERVCSANQAVAELMGAEKSSIIGRTAAEVWDTADAPRAHLALAGLASGATDNYRAHRRLRTDHGQQTVRISVHRLAVVGGAVGVALVVPEEEPELAGRSIRAVSGPDALHLMVGAVDSEGRIERVTPSSSVVLGQAQRDLVGARLISLVHPDDVDILMGSLRSTIERSEGSFVLVRLRHATRGWAETRCLFCRLADDAKSSIMFVLAQRVTDGPPGQDADQILALELQLVQFATDFQEDDWRGAQPHAVNATQFAALDELPRRQREVVQRLLRGERIPAIAEAMYISNSTARNHLSHVFTAFGVHSQAELLALLRSTPPIEPNGPGGGS